MMSESLMEGSNRIRLGLCLAAYGGCELRVAIEEVAGFGPLCLDLPTDTTLGLVNGRQCFDDEQYLQGTARELLRLRESGWPITCVSNSHDAQLLLGPHGPHTDAVFDGSAAQKREHAVCCALGTIKLAERIGAATVRLQLGCPDYARWLSWSGSKVSWKDNIDEFWTHAQPLLKAAQATGLTLLLEPHPKQIIYNRASANLLFGSAGEWDQTLALCVDPANLAAMGNDAVLAVTGWGKRMVAVHAKDLQRWVGMDMAVGAGWSSYGPQPPIRFRALGLGELDWSAIASRLIDESFDGVLYAEHEDQLLPRRQSIRRTLGELRRLLPDGTAEGRTW